MGAEMAEEPAAKEPDVDDEDEDVKELTLEDVNMSAGLCETYMRMFEVSREEIIEQKAAFDMLDLDKSGEITIVELKAFNDQLEFKLNDDELREQFKELDVNSDGRVCFIEMLKVWV